MRDIRPALAQRAGRGAEDSRMATASHLHRFSALAIAAFLAACTSNEPERETASVGVVEQALTMQLEAENGTNNGGLLEGGGDSGSKVILNSSGDSVCWSG